MKISKLHYITNGRSEAAILDEVETAINAGVDWVQLRIKDTSLDFLTIASKVKLLCAGKAIFLINDKVEIAKKVDADGVHLGLEDIPVSEARAILGNEKIIGGTANTIADCLMHERNGVDYIGLGPFRMTKTKIKLSPFLGLDGYREILPKQNNRVIVPVVAIGGIRLDDIELLKRVSSIHGIAVSGLIAETEDKKDLLAAINEKLT